MDIRKFFGGSSSSAEKTPSERAGKSALSDLRKEKKKKEEPVARTSKASPEKKRPQKVVPLLNIDDEFSEESPLSSTILGKEAEKKPKRSRVIDLSSDDELPQVQRGRNTRGKASVPPQKAKSPEKKRSKRVASSSPEKTPIKNGKKKGAARAVQPSSDEEEEEEEMEVVTTDSEDEFAEKTVKRKRGDLPKGQKKLAFTKAAPKPAAQPKASSSKDHLKLVQPADFFSDFGSKGAAVAKKAEKKVLTERRNETPSPRKSARVAAQDEEAGKKGKEKEESRASKAKASPEKKKAEEKEKPKQSSTKESTQEKRPPPSPPKRPATAKPSHAVALPPPAPPKAVFVPWVDKYKPSSVQQLVGQHGDKSPMNKLMAWLNGWSTWHLGEGGKIKRAKPPSFAETDGSPFKAILLSGSPGIGKTTCAHMACRVLGLNVVEMNASDVRNKKSLDAHAAQLIGCHSMDEYLGAAATKEHLETEVQHVLIMDEVDGMSGNEDRAGLSELIAMIKSTKIPLICICNDRQSPKMRSLVNHCYDVRFPKPRAEQMLARVMNIASQEKLRLTREEALELIEQSGHDVRQVIYNLQMKAAGGGTASKEQKDYAINTFDAARRLLGASQTLAERQQMFFVDYSIMPLFVQENYPKMIAGDKSRVTGKARDDLGNLRKAADLLAWGDTVEKAIRGGGAWKLLNEQSMLSAALPGLAMDGGLRSMIQFPSWLGRNSTQGKRLRLMRQLQHHANLKISASPDSLVMDYVPVLRDRLTRPLLERENDGVREVLDTMLEYDLLKDDADAIAELAVWPGRKDAGDKIAPKTKAALTRALNKESRMLPYVLEEVAKGRRAQAERDVEMDEFGNLVEKKSEEEALEEDDEEEEKTTAKPAPAKPAKAAAGGRGGRGGRGRGRGK